MKRSLIPALMLLSLALAGGDFYTARAQETGASLRMSAAQYQLNRLGVGAATDQAAFSVDQSTVVNVEIIAAIGGITTSVTGPAGQVITPGTVGGVGGAFNDISGTAAATGPSILPTLSANHHYVYSFPSLGPGTYTVRFQAPAGLADETPILTELTTDSPVVANLFATESTVFTGRTGVLSAALFDGQTPVAGAGVTVTLQNDAGATSSVTLRDDAGPGDSKAGDGLYSGQFTPTAAGRYSALAVITGTTAGGAAFTRHALTGFTVATAPGRLTGIAPDHGVDDNGDGLIDRVTFDVGAQVTAAGTFRAFVHLKTAGGKMLLGAGDATLQPGVGAVAVDVDAADFREAGEGGPYEVTMIELDAVEPNRQYTVDRRRGAGQTQAYLFSRFHRAPLVLTGVVTDQGFDDNGNGRFDRLRVNLQVDVLVAGFYRWSFKLTDQNSSKVDFARGQGFLSAGLNNLTLTYNGFTIGSTGANGPFRLEDLLLFGPKATIATFAGETQAYRSIQFENGREETGDTTPPSVNATLSAQPNPAGWNSSDVTVSLGAADNQGGSGVQSITYSLSGAQSAPPATVNGAAASVTVSAEGTTAVTYYARDNAGNVAAPRTLTLKLDKTAPTVNVSSPAGALLLRQAAAAVYGCGDALSGVSGCVGSAPNGAALDTSSVGMKQFTVTATDVAGNTRTSVVKYAVSYGVRLLYDASKSNTGGSTVPVRLQLVDANGANVSGEGVALHALGTMKVSDFAPGEVEDAGNANPDDNFRFLNVGGEGGYIFNLQTTGLTTGAYVLTFSAGADPLTHGAQFQIR